MQRLIGNKPVIEHLVGHGGFFKTPGVGQKIMADMLGIPVVVMENAGEGGAWGMAILAFYMRNGQGASLPEFLAHSVFGETDDPMVHPDPKDKKGADVFVKQYIEGLPIERAASAFLS